MRGQGRPPPKANDAFPTPFQNMFKSLEKKFAMTFFPKNFCLSTQIFSNDFFSNLLYNFNFPHIPKVYAFPPVSEEIIHFPYFQKILTLPLYFRKKITFLHPLF